MSPRRLLIVRLSHLGDVVSALPLFHALRSAFPATELAWVVQREFAGLLQGMPGLDRVVPFDRRRGPSAWLELRRELRAFGAEVAIDAQSNWKSAVATFLTGAERRLGLAPVDWREPSAARVLTESIPPMSSREPHVVQRMLALARFSIEALGGSVPTAAPRFDAALTERELELGRELADRHLPRSPRSPVVVHLATPGDVRSWPPDHYRRLTELLLARGRGVLLLSGPGEKDHGHHLRHVLGTRPGLVHWIDQNHPREACAFFTACARRSVPIVASDSGSMHLAAAAGMRVLALCGPQDAARTGPWSAGASSPHVALRAPEEPDCAPCFARVCTHADGPVCMGDLPPELVADAVRDLTTP